MDKNCLIFYKDPQVKGGSYYDKDFFIKYFPDVPNYTVPTDGYKFIKNYENIFFGYYPDWLPLNLKNKNIFQCVVSPDDIIYNSASLSTNNLKYSNDNKIPLLPFINEFYIKCNGDSYGTYLTKNSQNKIKILIHWLEKNLYKFKKFYIMSTVKDSIELFKLFGNKIKITHDRNEFFKNVKTIIYPKDPDFFEFLPNFIKEAVNCNCDIEIIGDINRHDGVNDLLELSENPFEINKVIEFYKYFINSNFNLRHTYHKTYSDFVEYINNGEYCALDIPRVKMKL